MLTAAHPLSPVIRSLPHCLPPVLQRARPNDAEQQLLALLQQFKEARAAWDEQCAAAAAEGGPEEQQEGLEFEDGDEEQVRSSVRC